ncbi:hypothetical protein T11_14367 [Trichinella zimbabwensis]|uniref:Uncharacterized protein n=1 Tax=Trichinella zimbabwensis TaxID=268475 RepID=A0A0V1GLP2_9BILA|nr:hypothetical protein T11_14367 [Trichinella zimbabwensis]
MGIEMEKSQNYNEPGRTLHESSFVEIVAGSNSERHKTFRMDNTHQNYILLTFTKELRRLPASNSR